jgi:hypothetical protein
MTFNLGLTGSTDWPELAVVRFRFETALFLKTTR